MPLMTCSAGVYQRSPPLTVLTGMADGDLSLSLRWNFSVKTPPVRAARVCQQAVRLLGALQLVVLLFSTTRGREDGLFGSLVW